MKQKVTDAQIYIPVSAGELIDKISILHIKSQKLTDPFDLRGIKQELKVLKNPMWTYICSCKNNNAPQ